MNDGRRTHVGYLLIAAAAALALYWGTSPWPDTPDGLFHLHRVRALAEALQMGVLLPRWFPDFAFGYGYPVLHYYAPLFYYPPALLHLMGMELLTAMRLALALWFGASALAMMALLRCWARPVIAAAGTVVYLAFPYRLYDLFVRGALPEFAAFFWLPLIAFSSFRLAQFAAAESVANGFWALLRRLLSSRWFALTALAWTGLALTHNLTALMAVLATLGCALLLSLSHSVALSSSHLQSRCLAPAVLLPLLFGLTLGAFHLAPSLLEAGWVGVGAAPAGDGFRRHFADWTTLATDEIVYRYPTAAEPTVPLPASLFALLAVALPALLFWRTSPLRPHLALTVALSVIIIFLMTSASAGLWTLAAPALGKLQFPWRWQTILALSFACMAATLLEAAARRLPERRAANFARAAGGALAVYSVVYAIAGLSPTPAPFSANELTREQMWRFDAEHGQVGATWTGEFLPRWVKEERWAIGRPPTTPTPGDATVSFVAVPEEQGYLRSTWRVHADAPLTLRFHRFYFPAWQALVNGVVAPAYPDGALGLLAVDLDAGEQRVEIRFAPTPALWLGLLLSMAALCTLALLLACSLPLRLTLAGLGVLTLLVVNLNLTERTIRPLPVGADYGSVRLEAAMIEALHPGRPWNVRLFWSVQRPEQPLTTFIHVVNAEGQMAAQKDEPLAGAFTPLERWRSGQLLDFTHRVALPGDLAPGVYTIYVGLYPSGRPDAPLQPLNRTETRLEVGRLEVRP
ncbi:MAG: hypothetical protein NZ553_10965 [Caldilinea sp.]|nr:hypothetical protein [Caldilinea sp.]MDW8440984.1 hypothetical protein [Caldilineaceae bacterium]